MKSKYLLLFIFIVVALTLTACEKEGTAEKAGKKIDHALDSAKDKLKEITK